MPPCDLSPGSTAVLLFLVSGLIGTLAYKLMGSQTVSEGGHQRDFYHPYMEAMTMAIGELLCLFIYYANLEKYKAPLEQGKTPHQFYYFLVPGFWDITLSVMQYFALNFISGSTYKLLQGGSIVTTLIFSRILLKMIIERRHLIGCSLAVFGLLVIGVNSLVNSSSGSDAEFGLQVLGCGIMVLSLVFQGYKYAYEQRMMIRHTIHYYQLVGWEGFFGIIIILIVSLLFSIIPCNFTEQLCVFDSHGNPYLQRFDVFFEEICSSWALGILVVAGTLACTVSNASGVAITKYFDGLTRCLMSMSKTAIVWIIGLIVTFSVEDPNYQLESKSLDVNLVKAAGFVFIIMGTLIYNKLILAKWLSKGEKEDAMEDDQGKIEKQLLSSGMEQSKA